MRGVIKCFLFGCFLSVTSAQAQTVLNRLEVGLSAQAVSGYADLNAPSADLLGSMRFVPALVVRYNMPYRFALRATVSRLDRKVLEATNPDSREIYEDGYVSLVGEFHFNDYNIYRNSTLVIPYLGLGLSMLNGLVSSDKESSTLDERLLSSSAVAHFGAKMKRNRFVVSAEIGTGVRLPTKDKSLLNDWYVFPNFTITYTFGPNF